MGWSLNDVAKAMGPSARVHDGVLELELINPDGTKDFYPFAACIQYIHTEAARRVQAPPPPPPPPTGPPAVDPPPPPVVDPPPDTTYESVVGAASMVRKNVQSISLDGDHINVWGRLGEAVEFTLHADEDVTLSIVYDYVLAKESGNSSTRAEKVNADSNQITFPSSSDLWADGKHGLALGSVHNLPAGDIVVSVTNDATADWSNWLDLYSAKVISNKPVTLTAAPTLPPPPPPPVPGPGPTLPPPQPGNGAIWNVPAQGTLQSVLDGARPGDTVYVSGIVSTDGYGYRGANRDNGDSPITIIGNPGHVLRCGSSGFEGFGSMRNWRLQNLLFEVSGGGYYNSGVSFYGQRTDFGGDGQGCSRISLINVTIRPIAGTGHGQRDGVTLWGGDLLEVGYCTVTDFSFNDLGMFGGAGSGISVGQTIRSPLPSLSNGTRVWVHHNFVRGQRGPGTPSADRNGINLDLYQSRPDALRGTTLIEDNDVGDCEGRGILAAWAGFSDSPILIYRNKIRPPMATNLGGSLPGGIVAYGGGIHSNIECIDNDVEVSPGFNAYLFEAVGNVLGRGNKGGPASGTPQGFGA